MQKRSKELTAFLKTLHTAIVERAQPESDSLIVTEKIMGALHIEHPASSPVPTWLPVCELIDVAINNVTKVTAEQKAPHQSSSNLSLIDHAQALSALAPQLTWWHRTANVLPGSSFATAHANAIVVGKGGLEERDDVSVGISLMAPDFQYPEHHHPPEEVYLVLSQGCWQKNGGDWIEPGVGGLVYNPGNMVHAMRSTSEPLLTTWCLWAG